LWLQRGPIYGLLTVVKDDVTKQQFQVQFAPLKVGKVVLHVIQRKKGHNLDKMMKLDLIEKSWLFTIVYTVCNKFYCSCGVTV